MSVPTAPAQLAYVPYQRRHRATPSANSAVSTSPSAASSSAAQPVSARQTLSLPDAAGARGQQGLDAVASTPPVDTPVNAAGLGAACRSPSDRLASQPDARVWSESEPAPGDATNSSTSASDTSHTPPPLPPNKPMTPPSPRPPLPPSEAIARHRAFANSSTPAGTVSPPPSAPTPTASPSQGPGFSSTSYQVRAPVAHARRDSSHYVNRDPPVQRGLFASRNNAGNTGPHTRSASASHPVAKPSHARTISGPSYSTPHSSVMSPVIAPTAPGGIGITHNISQPFFLSRRALAQTPARKEGELSEQRSLRRLDKLVRLHVEASRQFGLQNVPQGLIGRLKLHERAKSRQAFIREGEQKLVSWVPDNSEEAKSCALCHAVFGFSRGIRRHHCRLCGRCVCATYAGRASGHAAVAIGKEAEAMSERCSGTVGINSATLFVAPEFDEIRLPFASSAPLGVRASLDGKEGLEAEDVSIDSAATGATGLNYGPEVSRITTRICRECKATINRAQFMLPYQEANAETDPSAPQPPSPPDYVALHAELEKLDAQIASALPEFQEMVLGLEKAHAVLAQSETSSAPFPSTDLAKQKSRAKRHAQLQAQQLDTAAARRRLLVMFGEYERVARQLRPPARSDPSNAHHRIRESIWNRANWFLQQNLFPLQALPKVGKEKSGSQRASETSTPTESDARALAAAEEETKSQNQMLSVLAEQATLVQQYLDEAKTARRWDDASTLEKTLHELQGEMRNLILSLPRTASAGRTTPL